MKTYPVLGRAIGLRDALADALEGRDLATVKWWWGWADRSRPTPFRKLSRTVKSHPPGIPAHFETQLANAAIQAVNGLLQIAIRIAGASGDFHCFRLAAYLKAGNLKLHLSHALPA